MQFRDLKKQYQVLKPQIDEAVLKVMNDCNFISGSQVRELEQRLADYVGVKHCISCANGTDALELAERACGIGRGQAVFVPDFTFFSTAETVADLGAEPVFVDVDADTFNISAEALERAVLKIRDEGRLEARAVVAVDLFGQPADYAALREITDKYGLILIEDGAQGFGGRIGKQRACSFGDISTTSFFPAKPLGCYGDGGAVFTDDDNIAELIRSLCVHGKSKTDKYDNLRLGRNSRLDTIQAAVLGVKLSAFEDYELSSVNRAAGIYNGLLSGKLKTPLIKDNYFSSYAQYTVKFENQETRDRVQAALKQQGIPSMIYYPKPLHSQAAFSGLSHGAHCPAAESLCRTVLALPICPYISDESIEHVSRNILELL